MEREGGRRGTAATPVAAARRPTERSPERGPPRPPAPSRGGGDEGAAGEGSGGGGETRRGLSAGWICPSARPGPALRQSSSPSRSQSSPAPLLFTRPGRSHSAGALPGSIYTSLCWIRTGLEPRWRPSPSRASRGGAGGPHWGNKGGLKEQLPAQWRGVSILQEKWCSASWASAREAREEAPSLPAQQRTLPRPCPPPSPFPGRGAPQARPSLPPTEAQGWQYRENEFSSPGRPGAAPPGTDELCSRPARCGGGVSRGYGQKAKTIVLAVSCGHPATSEPGVIFPFMG